MTRPLVLALACGSPLLAACPSTEPEPEAAAGTTTAGPAESDEADTAPATDAAADATSAGDSSTGGESSGSTDTGPTGPSVPIPDPVADDCITEVTAGHHRFACGEFTFDVEVPEVCIGLQCGLVVDVHGYTMDAAMQDKNTGMAALGVEHGYVVVQPNANPEPPDSSWDPADDAAVFDFAMRTVDAFHLDPDRLHFTGFSQGGYMSWRFLCNYGDVFASIAPGAACGSGVALGCSPDATTPAGTPDVLYIHGRTDALVPYDGCAEPQRDSVLAGYGMTDPPEVLADESDYRWNRWTSPDGATFEMLDHDYAALSLILAGHCFPGSPDAMPELPGQLLGFGCNPVSPIHYGEIVMDFFVAHPKR